MPYGIRRGGRDCPFEVYNTETGERAPGGCHPSRATALGHQRALMRNVEAAILHAELEASPAVEATGTGEHFHAVAHTEGASTGLRTFTNLSWRDVPFAFHWQKSSSAHGGTPMTVQVGLVRRMERDAEDENIIHAWGDLDLASDDGREYGRQLVSGFARWVSIGLDEQPIETTIEWDEEAEGESPPDAAPPNLPGGLPIGKPKQV